MPRKIALSLCLLTLLPLQAAARNYNVEAIIFAHVVEIAPGSEHWDKKAPRNIRAQNSLDALYRQAEEAEKRREDALLTEQMSATPVATTADTEDTPIQTVTSHELNELLAIQDTLIQSPHYEILQTLTWNQSEANYIDSPLIPTVTPHMMGVIRIYAPNLLFAELNLTYVPDSILEKSLEEDSPLEESRVITEPSPYTPGVEYATEPLTEPAFMRFFLQEQRKLKLNEVHYFDHPRFGVILSVKPLEETKG